MSTVQNEQELREIKDADQLASWLVNNLPEQYLKLKELPNGSPFNMGVLTNGMMLAAVRLVAAYAPMEDWVEAMGQLADTLSIEFNRIMGPDTEPEEEGSVIVTPTQH